MALYALPNSEANNDGAERQHGLEAIHSALQLLVAIQEVALQAAIDGHPSSHDPSRAATIGGAVMTVPTPEPPDSRDSG